MTLAVLLARAALALVPASSNGAYPIAPQPLRKLCLQSELIVVAEAHGKGGVVELEITETLKGLPPGRFVSVDTHWGMVCPTPPNYPPGETVLAFLCRGVDEDRYDTQGLSYGSKVLDPEGLRVYTPRVREILEIDASALSAEDRRLKTVEWLVKCAEDPITRWEGAYELAAAGDPRSDLAREYGVFEDAFAAFLTDAQRARLLEALLAAPSVREGELCLIGLFRDSADPRLTPFLVDRLRALARRGDTSTEYTYQLMVALVRRTDVSGALVLAERYKEEHMIVYGLSLFSTLAANECKLEEHRLELHELLEDFLELYGGTGR